MGAALPGNYCKTISDMYAIPVTCQQNVPQQGPVRFSLACGRLEICV